MSEVLKPNSVLSAMVGESFEKFEFEKEALRHAGWLEQSDRWYLPKSTMGNPVSLLDAIKINNVINSWGTDAQNSKNLSDGEASE